MKTKAFNNHHFSLIANKERENLKILQNWLKTFAKSSSCQWIFGTNLWEKDFGALITLRSTQIIPNFPNQITLKIKT